MNTPRRVARSPLPLSAQGTIHLTYDDGARVPVVPTAMPITYAMGRCSSEKEKLPGKDEIVWVLSAPS